MEIGNSTQQQTPLQMPTQDQSFKSNVLNQRGNVLIIIAGVILLLIVGAGAYYFGTKNNQSTNSQPPETTNTQSYPPQTQTAASPTPNLVTNTAWKTETVQIKKETAVSGSENINLAIQSPSDWTLKTVIKASNPNDLIKNCADYVFTSADSIARLTISPVCSGWAAEYSDWPQSTVIIKEEKNVGNDGHTAYTVRYLDSTTNQYKYVEGEKGTSNKIMDAILIRYNSSTGNFLPTRIILDYSGANKESILEITDKIVTTLSAK